LPTTTLAQSIGDISGVQAGTERQYVGDLIEIELATGNKLAATPNHPIATPSGWVAISELKVGDNVLKSTSPEWVVDSVNPDIDHVIPTIQEVVESLPMRFNPMPMSTEDFHGDGTDGEVYIVRTNSELGDRSEPSFSEHRSEEPFGRGDISKPRLDRTGTFDLLGLGHDSSPGSSMSSFSDSLALLSAHLSHPSVHPFTPVSGRDAVLSEYSTDDVSADSEGFCEKLFDLSPDITSDQIISIRRYPFSGHVYNLDSTEGWYIGNSIITHNCRCALTPAMGG
jgi:hypothetical protein